MANDDGRIGVELGSVPMGELVRSLALAIADAQVELDRSSILVAQQMAAPTVAVGFDLAADGASVQRMASMMELGFAPNFYRFVDTIIEVKLALRINKTQQTIDPATGRAAEPSPERGSGLIISSTPVDATYASTYGFDLQFASVFKTTLVSIPPPANLDERLRELMRERAAQTEAKDPE